ncbi:MAG: hypothetical protein QM768_19290 [Agriterribacter sp.]
MKKRVARFNLQNFDTSHITPDAIQAWIGKIHKSYPGFKDTLFTNENFFTVFYNFLTSTP